MIKKCIPTEIPQKICDDDSNSNDFRRTDCANFIAKKAADGDCVGKEKRNF